jgi:hypothetical protein
MVIQSLYQITSNRTHDAQMAAGYLTPKFFHQKKACYGKSTISQAKPFLQRTRRQRTKHLFCNLSAIQHPLIFPQKVKNKRKNKTNAIKINIKKKTSKS